MLLFDFSDRSIKVLKLSSGFLARDTITAYVREEIRPGLIEDCEIVDSKNLAEEVKTVLSKATPKPLVDQYAAFVIHDERSYTLRLNLPGPDSDKSLDEAEITQQVETLLPVALTSQVSAFLGQEFISVDQRIFSQYLDLFHALKLDGALAVPESHAIFTLLSPQILEGESALFLDIGSETTDAVVMDKSGVIQTFTEPIETTRLIEEVVGKLLPFIKDKFKVNIEKIFLGGGGVLTFDQKNFAEETKRNVISAEEVLKTCPLSFKADFGKTTKLGFLSLFGLALLLKQKNPLNLIHRP